MVCISCVIIPLGLVIGILTILMSYFDFRGIMTYVKDKTKIIVVSMSSIFGGGTRVTVPHE
jgi:hypothetical protein